MVIYFVWFLSSLFFLYFYLNSFAMLWMIISMGLFLVGCFCFLNFAFLGLMWGLVYLGGMMIIFVYVIFISQKLTEVSFLNNKINHEEEHTHHLNSLKFDSFNWVLLTSSLSFTKFFYLLKMNSWEIYNQILINTPEMNSWEIYNQILINTPFFIYFLFFLILVSLVIILGMLKKNFFEEAKASII